MKQKGNFKSKQDSAHWRRGGRRGGLKRGRTATVCRTFDARVLSQSCAAKQLHFSWPAEKIEVYLEQKLNSDSIPEDTQGKAKKGERLALKIELIRESLNYCLKEYKKTVAVL